MVKIELLRASLVELDGILDRLHFALTGLRNVKSNPEGPLVSDLQRAVRTVREIEERVQQIAEEEAVPPPTWRLRAELDRQLEELKSQIEERGRAGASAARHKSLASYLATASIRHAVARVRTTLETIREEAVGELKRAAEQAGTAELPGPAEAAVWVGWAGLNADEIEKAGFIAVAELARAVLCEDRLIVPAEGHVQPTGATGGESPQSDLCGAEPEAEAIEAPPAAALTTPVPSEAEPAAASTEVTESVVTAPEAQKPEPRPPVGSPPERPTRPLKLAAPEVARTPRRALSENIASFDAFSASHWLASTGECEKAPWTIPGFADRLTASLHECLGVEIPRFAEAHVLCRAAQAIGARSLPLAEDISALGEVWSGSRPASAVFGAARLQAVRHAIENGEACGEAGPIALFLAAIQSSPAFSLTPVEIDPAMELAGLRSSHLRAVLAELVRLGANGDGNPAGTLRAAAARLQRGSAMTPEEAEREFEAARRGLHEYARKVWSAGGFVQRTHCRKAWNEFMVGIANELEALFPASAGGRKTWDPGSIASWIATIEGTHQRIADRRGAKLQDRNAMDRAVAKLAEHASRVNEAYRTLQGLRSGSGQRANGSSPHADLIARFLESGAPHDEEGAVHRTLARLLTGAEPVERPLHFESNDLVAWPDLLRCVPDGAIEASGSPQRFVLRADAIAHPLLAAAILLSCPATPLEESGRDALRARLSEPHRELLQLRLPGLLDERVQRQLQARRLELPHELHTKLGAVVTALADAALPLQDGVAAAWGEARERLEGRSEAPTDPALFAEWIRAVLAEAQEELAGHRESLLVQARSESDEIRSLMETAIREGRLGEAMRVRLGAEAAGPSDGVRRETYWRSMAAAAWPKPTETLRSIADTLPPEASRLVKVWLGGASGRPARDAPIRSAFANAFLAPFGLETHDEPEQTRVECERIRRRIAEKGLNPSCLPQLGRLEDLVFLVPPVQVGDRRLGQEIASRVASVASDRRHFVVALLPALSASTREDLHRLFRQRNLVAAVVDDLDVCRLLNPGGALPEAVLGLLEILLEQQDLKTFNPFEVAEGSQVQVEMFFGRKAEAEKLTGRPTYSRIFSGRKLGKSALLRFVESRYDGHTLPSRNSLRVLYVSAVGVESEAVLVQKILSEMEKRLAGFSAPRRLAEPGPAALLATAIARYLRDHPSENLLFVLDEADTFIEKQIQEYDAKRENCLSFQMRSAIEAEQDSQNLPRARFVFAGYRVANTNSGAWANWGEVLRLEPLSPQDARQLVSLPFARLGVDVSRQADMIAYRCGYQPAVLLRLCEQLVTRLAATPAATARWRKPVEIQQSDVTLAFDARPVADEILTVAQNNFQGNPVAKVIFGCLLNEFLLRPPGQALEDAESIIKARLEELSAGDLGWLTGDRTAVSAELSRHLRELVERGLLVERVHAGESVVRYALRVPHHARILESLGETDRIRADINQIKGAPAGPAESRCIVDPSILKWLSGVVSSPTEAEFLPLVTLSSHWPEAVIHESSGVAERLGVETGRVGPCLGQARKLVAEPGKCVLIDSTPEAIRQLTTAAAAWRCIPLFEGGASLLRWQLGPGGDPLEDDGKPVIPDRPASLGRLRLQTFRWWFERVRGLTFPSSEVVGDLFRRTSGIPVLARLLDDVLVGKGGAGSGVDLSQQQVTRALERFEARIPEVAALLTSSDPRFGLTPREVELLRMTGVAARVGGCDTLLQALEDEGWMMLFHEHLPLKPLGPGDEQRLELLCMLGLIPTHDGPQRGRSGAFAVPPPDDAIVRLGAAFAA